MAITSNQDQITALDAEWSSLGVDLNQCPAMASSTPDGAAFDNDFSAWKQFTQNPPTIGFQDAFNQWQTKLSEWQQKVRSKGCKVSGLNVAPPAPPPSSPPLVGPHGSVIDTTSTAATLGAVVVVGGIGVLGLVLLANYLSKPKPARR